jgi:hypothetical protein
MLPSAADVGAVAEIKNSEYAVAAVTSIAGKGSRAAFIFINS